MYRIFLVLLINLLPLLFIDAVAQGISQSDDCATVMAKFSSSDVGATDKEKERIQMCMGFCEASPNFSYTRKYCGVDQCISQTAISGKPSVWCCRMARTWGSKLGARTNPLAGVLAQCSGRQYDFSDCTGMIKNTGTLSERCCTKLSDIKKFDAEAGALGDRICGSRRAAQACKGQFTQSKGFTKACCEYANYNGGFVDTPAFMNDRPFAMMLEKNLSSCNTANNKIADSDTAICMRSYKRTGRATDECCRAFYNGTLIPGAKGIDFNVVDSYCFPDNYR